MKSAILAFGLVALTSLPTSAQDSTVIGWRKSLLVDVTTTQTSYSDSWVGGEAGSFNWVANLNGGAERQMKSWFNYRATLKLSFGQTMTQDEQSKDWSRPKKSTDLIDWENLGRFTFNKFVDPYAAFRLESQFYTPLHPQKKAYLSPVKLTESAGLARRFYQAKKDDQITSRLGFALRQILKKDILDTVSFATVDTTFTDGGLESVTDISLTLNSNLRYVGKLSLYKALYFSESSKVKGTPFENDWKAVDINLENLVSANVTKIVAVTFYTQILYDRQVSYKGRFKETLGIGFAFKLA
ncbi:MAG: DUF3078 domain-containing protein [Candidatus Zixiibacteriota bacterium]